MHKLKYIVFDTGLCDSIVLFPDVIQHRDIANGMQWPVLGAGFIQLDANCEWHCFGKSISLNVASRPEDTLIARRQLSIDN
jgi:hypothetical protein